MYAFAGQGYGRPCDKFSVKVQVSAYELLNISVVNHKIVTNFFIIIINY
jgi:hypothetical protein